jgi:hypothetical protein
MADTKKPSLTVLGGPMAGTRFVFEDAFEEVTVGSDEGCSFRLQLPGVGPNHARIVIEGGAMSIHDTDTGGERGLHVNDNRVGEGGTALRNGDIVWLGTPGDAEVVMLQCILPRSTPASPVPPPAAPMSAAPEDETATLALEPDTLFGVETVSQPPPSVSDPPVALAEEFVLAQEPSAAPEPVTFAIDDEPTHMLPPSRTRFEDETNERVMDPPFVVPEESSTVLLDAAEVTGDLPEPTVVLPAEPEVTLAMPPPERTMSVPWSPPAQPAPVKPAAPKPSPPPVSKTAPPPAVAKTPPVRPAPSPRPRPQPAERSTPPPPRASGGSSTGRYVGIGMVALLVLAAGGSAAWFFLLKKPGPKVTQALPAPTTLPSASTPLVTQATPHPIATAEPRPVEPPTPAPVVATPTPKASAAPAASPSPSPSASPSPKKGSPSPPPVTSTVPSAEAQRAQQAAAQVATLLGQAEAALGSRQYDQAIGHFDEVLRLDPQNAKALADKATAVSLREAARKKFVPGRTAVKTEKASGGLAGFDSGDVAVQKAPDFLGRIEFEMSPASGIKPGDAYTLRFFLVNEGKKAIRIQGITVSTVVNGTGSGAPVAAATREVAPQQRAQLGEASGSWKDGTTSWSTEVLVTANKGDSLKNQITWR